MRRARMSRERSTRSPSAQARGTPGGALSARDLVQDRPGHIARRAAIHVRAARLVASGRTVAPRVPRTWHVQSGRPRARLVSPAAGMYLTFPFRTPGDVGWGDSHAGNTDPPDKREIPGRLSFASER